MTKPLNAQIKDTTLDYLIKTRSNPENPLDGIIEKVTDRMIESDEVYAEKVASKEFLYLIDVGFSHTIVAYIIQESLRASLNVKNREFAKEVKPWPQ